MTTAAMMIINFINSYSSFQSALAKGRKRGKLTRTILQNKRTKQSLRVNNKENGGRRLAGLAAYSDSCAEALQLIRARVLARVLLLHITPPLLPCLLSHSSAVLSIKPEKRPKDKKKGRRDRKPENTEWRHKSLQIKWINITISHYEKLKPATTRCGSATPCVVVIEVRSIAYLCVAWKQTDKAMWSQFTPQVSNQAFVNVTFQILRIQPSSADNCVGRRSFQSFPQAKISNICRKDYNIILVFGLWTCCWAQDQFEDSALGSGKLWWAFFFFLS